MNNLNDHRLNRSFPKFELRKSLKSFVLPIALYSKAVCSVQLLPMRF
jgi:hypothetical protein